MKTNPISEHRKKLENAFKKIKIKNLARRLAVTDSYIYNIKYGYRQVSPGRAIELEKMTKGKLTRYLLRPDIFGSRRPLRF